MATSTTNYDYPSNTPPLPAVINASEVAIEFNNDVDEIGREESNPVIQYETFLVYSRSANPSERETAIREVPNVLREMNVDKDRLRIELIFNLVENVFAKEKDTRLYELLVEQIPTLYVEFLAVEYLLKRANKVFPDFIATALEHPTEDVRRAAIGAVDILVEQGLLPRESLQNVICPTLFDHCYCSTDYTHFISDEQRTESAALLCKIVTTPAALTKKWIFENFLGRYSVLLHDPAFHVRKVCVTILGKLAIMFGKTFTEQFAVPFVMALSADPIWGVRKSSSEVFVDIANTCSKETKECQLAPRFITLLHDSSRWVIYTALQQLGPFIATFADETRMGQEIRDGRLVAANSDIAEIAEDPENNNGNIVEGEGSDLYNQLPPGVVLPDPARQGESGASCSAASASQNESVDCSAGTGVAALCSTHPDLTKLVPDDDYDDAYDLTKLVLDSDLEFEKSDGEEDDEEDDDDGDIEEAYPMEIEFDDDDIEICFEEPAQVQDYSDVNAYGQVAYWSAGYIDVDLGSYGQGTAVAHNNNNKKSPKKLISEFIQRHSDMLFKVAKLSTSDTENVNGMLPLSKNKRVEEVEMHETDSNSDELNKTYVIRQESPANSVVDDEDERTASTILSARTQEVVPQELLDSYVHMVLPSDSKDSEINRHCAHSFPAVAFTLGRSNWPCIMGTYQQLASDVQWRVRHTLASSIHEIAAIIGEENADAHLAPVFEEFMKDVEDVRLGLLMHLYDFFKLVTPAVRRRLLSALPNFLHSNADNTRNWRYRHQYIRQCILLCDLFDIHDINEYLSPIAFTLANDKVSEVRKEASLLLAKILGKFVSEEWNSLYNDSTSTDVSPIPITDKFVHDIVRTFVETKSWQRRQTFALFCEKTLEDGVLSYDQFASLLLEDLLRLSGDPRANVRLVFARALTKTRAGRVFSGAQYQSITRQGLEALLSDKDIECRRTARNLLGIPDNEDIIDAKDYGERLDEREKITEAKYQLDHTVSLNNESASETV